MGSGARVKENLIAGCTYAEACRTPPWVEPDIHIPESVMLACRAHYRLLCNPNGFTMQIPDSDVPEILKTARKEKRTGVVMAGHKPGWRTLKVEPVDPV